MSATNGNIYLWEFETFIPGTEPPAQVRANSSSYDWMEGSQNHFVGHLQRVITFTFLQWKAVGLKSPTVPSYYWQHFYDN